MKRVIIAAFIIFLALTIKAEAQTFSILTGTVTEVKGRWLVIRSEAGDVVHVRVGKSTVYTNHMPFEGDKVKVEYLINREVSIGYAVTVLEGIRKPKESRFQVPPDLPPEISFFIGRWEGSWDKRKDMNFTLTIANLNLEVAEVKYESSGLNFSEKAKVISGKKPKIELMIHRKEYNPSEFNKGYNPSQVNVMWFTFEIQGERTLKGTLEDRSINNPVMRKAVLRRMD